MTELSSTTEGVLETASLHHVSGYAAASILCTVANHFEVLFDEHDNLIYAVRLDHILAIAAELEGASTTGLGFR